MEKDAKPWAEEKRAFEANQAKLERELKELKEKTQEQPVPVAQSPEISSVESISQAMSRPRS